MATLPEVLLETFRTNVLRVVDPDDYKETVWQLTPVDAASVSAGPAPEPALHIIPAFNPGGRLTWIGESVAHRETLEFLTLKAGGGFAVGAAHAPDLSWAEESIVVSDLDDERAAALAREHEQPAFWRWRGDQLTVLDADASVRAEVTVAVQELLHVPCVMPRNQPSSTERCVRPGGPWVRRSIEMAAFWTRDRNDLLSVLYCEICQATRPPGPGAPLLLDRWTCAS